ncbi:lactase-phlorizin hydrolase-like [Helicoverpa zea]|uniref:lactase-phlorizin hydrolase-like n=1 Tax=Helicoverpa zea TaxID=7113 RepID=UPI001F59E71B|nr:lactase-phlorizin hydrolase-like [Helicoverpa zea]
MKYLIVCFLAVAATCLEPTVRNQRRFPDDFLFGAATASYQIEGGWDADGKGENIWDRLTHTNPTVIQDLTNGDIAADSYHNYKRDVEMMRELGLDAYRFSISWARILPTGFSNEINPPGIEYYNNLINEMVKYNITPMVTLYHWDLPQKLQDLGGLMNPLFTEWFEDYARVVFENFGDRVKLFITFNEPREICFEGLEDMNKAPLLNTTGVGVYLCAKNLVMAHARAYHLYDKEFRATQGGQCGITISVNWFGPATNSAEDELAAEIMRQVQWGLYAEPIFSAEGGFPRELSQRIAEKSAQQGFSRSRLPDFTEEEKAYVQGASDFFGVNHYTTILVSATEHKAFNSAPSMMDDADVGYFVPPEWPVSSAPWLKFAPNSVYYALTHLSEKYNNPNIYITENGWATYPDSGLVDDDRIAYYRAALESALDVLEEGVNLKGYMAWSLMDNMEWLEGYVACFGLYHVDYKGPARSRTARKTAFIYKHIIKNRYIDYEYEPESLTMTIDEGYLLAVVATCQEPTVSNQRRFPDDFLFGAATASYQIEGGWDADGKGENIWDHLTHTNPAVVQDLTNGDIAADSYHNYKRDVEMMRELGLDAYRFSISWARILPTGFSNEINPPGIEYYNNLINEMVKYNITPMVTLYHWDLPQKLQDLGGLMNPLFTEWFEDYARVVFENFGDRVKLFITFNEPREICFEGLEAMNKAPLLNTTGVGVYLCAKNLVMAHARAYHLYDKEFRATQGGQCGITISVNWFGPATNSAEDKLAAEIMRQVQWGLYAEPIFSAEGGFPRELSQRIAEKSAQQGFSRSRLPDFTEEEKAYVKGASDFFGVNHYTTALVSATEHKTFNSVPSMMDDVDLGYFVPPEWPVSSAPWLKLAPNSIYHVLTHLKEKYNNLTIYITENGWATYPDSGLVDDDRITYHRAALEDALDALDAGVNLKGYMAWSLMDNMEWLEGYVACFGLYHMDFQDPARTRTARKSAFIYKHIIKNRYIDYEYEPESLTMTIDEGY